MGNSDLKVFFGIFIGVILAVALLGPAADTIFNSTNTFNQTNLTITSPDADENLSLIGRSLVVGGAVSVFNNTDNNGSVIDASNFTFQTGIVNGVSSVIYTNLESELNGTSLNISYLFVPDGFVPGGGGTILSLVILFGSLAVLIFVVAKVMKEGSMVNFLRNK